MHTVYYAKFNIERRFKFATTEKTTLVNLMVYGCCIMLLFGTKSRLLCTNYNFDLLMHKQTKPNLRVNLEESMCVIMKGSKVSSGKAY